MRWWTLLVVLLILLMPKLAHGQEPRPIEALPPGDDVIAALAKGQPAPFDGQLFDISTSLRWANWLRQYKMRLRLDVQEQKDLCRVQTDSLQAQKMVEQVKYERVLASYEKYIDELKKTQQPPPWYKTPTFYVTTGAAATTAVFIGAILLVGAASN